VFPETTMIETPDLRTEKIVLRPWRADDLDAMVSALQDPEIPRWTTVPERYGVEEGRLFLDASAQGWADGTSAHFAVVDAEDERLLGSIGARFHEEGAARVGYWTVRDARGRGLATEALRLVSRWVLTNLSVERLELFTEPGNVRSQRVAEKAGFTREGLLRRYLVVKGQRRDCVLFSLLREELR
jgi:RimJ/RimL family protein N-acetyltransferase